MPQKPTKKKVVKRKTLSKSVKKSVSVKPKHELPPVLQQAIDDKIALRAQEDIIRAYRNLFSKGKDADIVLADMMTKGGISVFLATTDYQQTLRNEGVRRFIFSILKKIGLTDEDIQQHIMNRVNNQRKR